MGRFFDPRTSWDNDSQQMATPEPVPFRNGKCHVVDSRKKKEKKNMVTIITSDAVCAGKYCVRLSFANDFAINVTLDSCPSTACHRHERVSSHQLGNHHSQRAAAVHVRLKSHTSVI